MPGLVHAWRLGSIRIDHQLVQATAAQAVPGVVMVVPGRPGGRGLPDDLGLSALDQGDIVIAQGVAQRTDVLERKLALHERPGLTATVPAEQPSKPAASRFGLASRRPDRRGDRRCLALVRRGSEDARVLGDRAGDRIGLRGEEAGVPTVRSRTETR